jgi:hypothetical protein
MSQGAIAASVQKSRMINFADAMADSLLPVRSVEGNWRKNARPFILRGLNKAVAYEREECAKVLDALAEKWKEYGGEKPFTDAAAEIRARGKQ